MNRHIAIRLRNSTDAPRSENEHGAKQGRERLVMSALGPRLLGYRELASHLGIGVSTCKRWVANGVLPPPDIRIGGIVRWSPQTIDKWQRHHGSLKGGGR